jgi:hypothetical protein
MVVAVKKTGTTGDVERVSLQDKAFFKTEPKERIKNLARTKP